jgi:hypothetical protein
MMAVVGSALLGIAFLIGAFLGSMAKDQPPLVLPVCIAIGGILQLGVANGLRNGSRGAWSLGVAMDGILTLVAFTALPAMFRAGVPKAAGIGAVIGCAVMFAVLLGSGEKKKA